MSPLRLARLTFAATGADLTPRERTILPLLRGLTTNSRDLWLEPLVHYPLPPLGRLQPPSAASLRFLRERPDVGRSFSFLRSIFRRPRRPSSRRLPPRSSCRDAWAPGPVCTTFILQRASPLPSLRHAALPARPAILAGSKDPFSPPPEPSPYTRILASPRARMFD